jgi:hypothetical protein
MAYPIAEAGGHVTAGAMGRETFALAGRRAGEPFAKKAAAGAITFPLTAAARVLTQLPAPI